MHTLRPTHTPTHTVYNQHIQCITNSCNVCVCQYAANCISTDFVIYQLQAVSCLLPVAVRLMLVSCDRDMLTQMCNNQSNVPISLTATTITVGRTDGRTIGRSDGRTAVGGRSGGRTAVGRRRRSDGGDGRIDGRTGPDGRRAGGRRPAAAAGSARG